AVLAADRERAAPGGAPAHAENPAGAGIALAIGDREVSRCEPVAEVFGARPCLEHAAARRVEDARHQDRFLVFHSALLQVAGELVEGSAPALLHAFAAFLEALALGFTCLVRQPGHRDLGP